MLPGGLISPVTFFGGQGNDLMKAGNSNVYMEGRTGDDTYDLTATQTTAAIIESAGAGTDRLIAARDLTGVANVEVLELSGNGNFTAISTLQVNRLIGNAQGNMLRADAQTFSQTIEGGGGLDVIFGGSGDDVLDGGAGLGDQVTGNAGNDRLIDLFGGDTLTGGAGVDTFVLAAHPGAVTRVMDLEIGIEKLDLSALGIDAAQAASVVNVIQLNPFNYLIQVFETGIGWRDTATVFDQDGAAGPVLSFSDLVFA